MAGARRTNVEIILEGVEATNRRDAWFEEAFGALWAASHTRVDEIIEARDDLVLLGFHRTARGRASGAETTLRGWNVFWFTDGKVARREGPFWDREEALEAVRLAAGDGA